MAKQKPAWILMGLPEAPPVVQGYHDYGTVYRPEWGPQREGLRRTVRLAVWSWSYWGKKVRRDILAVREEGGRSTLTGRTLDRVALTLVLAVEGLDGRLGPLHPKG